MDSKTQKLLTDGLIAGYAGQSELSDVIRSTFVGKQSDFSVGDGIYHDEWFAHEIGGGQELVDAGGSKFTRLYAGGSLEAKSVKSLGIAQQDISDFLKKQLIDLGGKTRLLDDCLPAPVGDWQYFYRILERHSSIPITTGRESITYKGTEVHIHQFMICCIK